MEARTILLYCATANPGKVSEFQEAAAYLDGAVHIQMLPGIRNIPVPEESGRTFLENAELKARYYSGFTDQLVFSDDSGLCVAALGGDPGVLSARFGGPQLNDEQRVKLLLSKIGDQPNRSAWFECVLSVARQGQILQSFTGRVDGEILATPTGSAGFGYDPVFQFQPLGLTFAQLQPEVKRTISHRGRALKAMVRWLVRADRLTVQW